MPLNHLLRGAALVAVLGVAAPALANHHEKDGMSEEKAKPTIAETVSASPDHTTLLAAVSAAGLVETLSGDGPFTVFAPTDAAFAALPAGTVDTLLKPENSEQLTKVLTAHVVSGKVSSSDLVAQIASQGGEYEITTVSGDTLIAKLVDGAPVIVDENGGVAAVTAADLKQSNGYVHVVDKVLLPQ